MAAALEQTSEVKPKSAEQKAEKFLAERREKYFAALDNARAASDTTNTIAWQSNYKEQTRFHRGVISAAAKTLENVADILKSRESDEELEKEINDAKKSLTEERIRWTAWLRRTVEPYSDTVKNCDEKRNEAVALAREAERSTPLVENGLAEAVRKIVASWPKPEWNFESGVVSIRE